MPHPIRCTPRKDPVPTIQEAGWAPGPVWMGVEQSNIKKSFAISRNLRGTLGRAKGETMGIAPGGGTPVIVPGIPAGIPGIPGAGSPPSGGRSGGGCDVSTPTAGATEEAAGTGKPSGSGMKPGGGPGTPKSAGGIWSGPSTGVDGTEPCCSCCCCCCCCCCCMWPESEPHALIPANFV
jgi:hypothetical protein